MRSVTWESFLASPAGRTVLAWEEGACARFLANKSGNRALQIGFGALNPFAASPITHRILIDDVVHAHASESDFRDRVLAQADALPLCDECCDAIVLAHTFDRHPEKLQATVNEAARVLAPNGLLIALFFNAMGSWTLREKVFPSRKFCPTVRPAFRSCPSRRPFKKQDFRSKAATSASMPSVPTRTPPMCVCRAGLIRPETVGGQP